MPLLLASLGAGEMTNACARRRCRLGWTVVSLCTLAVTTLPGCTLPKKQNSMATLTSAKQFDEVSITYRTESDRVNLAAAGESGPAQMVSFQPSSTGLLPGVTTTTLDIQQPHPDGIPGYARARVLVRANGAEESQGGSIWGRLVGRSDDQGAGSDKAQIVEAWLLDIPAWQVDGIMKKLQKQNFFRRAKVLDAETFLAVKADGAGFGKKYRALPELDALILRTRREGRPVGRPTQAVYGPTQPTYGSTPPAYNPAQAPYASTQPTYDPAQPPYSPAQAAYGSTHATTGSASPFAPPSPTSEARLRAVAAERYSPRH